MVSAQRGVHRCELFSFDSVRDNLRPLNRVVLLPARVRVPVLLHPLQELEVVLHLALDEALDGNRLDVSGPEKLVQPAERQSGRPS